MKQTIEVTECYNACPFFTTSGMEHMMECNHPYWVDKGAYAGAIITHENSRGRVPEKCPLRSEALEIKYILG